MRYTPYEGLYLVNRENRKLEVCNLFADEEGGAVRQATGGVYAL